MANVSCPRCGCALPVYRGVRRREVVFCCQNCAEGKACECSGCPAEARGGGGGFGMATAGSQPGEAGAQDTAA